MKELEGRVEKQKELMHFEEKMQLGVITLREVGEKNN